MKGRGRENGAALQVAVEAYNAGNHLLGQGDAVAAIREYDTAIELISDFASAYYNRALAHARIGDEPAALADLKTAAQSGFDEDYFYDTWVRHQRDQGGYASVVLLCDALDVPAHQRHRLEAELGLHLRQRHFLLAEDPEAGLKFAPESLALRCDVGDLLDRRFESDPATLDHMLGRLAEGVADPEAEWRARYLLAVLYGSDVLQPLEMIGGKVGLFGDVAQMETALAPASDDVEAAMDSVLGHHDPRWRALERKARFARFALAQLERAGEILLTDRRFRLATRRASFAQWEVVEGLWRDAVELSLHLDDAASYSRSVERARRFGALVDARRTLDSADWVDSDPAEAGHRLDALYGQTPGESAASVQPRNLVVEYFVYEKATDTVAWCAIDSKGSRLGFGQLPPDLVVTLLGIALQWESPEAIAAELNFGDNAPNAVEFRHLALRMLLARTDVPSGAYPTAVDDAILGGVRDMLGDAERLVIVPWGYLHNLPIHLLQSARSAIDFGNLREIVYSPSPARATLISRIHHFDRQSARVLFVAVGEELPSLAAESDLIHKLYPAASLLTGKDATPKHVMDELSGCDVVHFACHGGFDRKANSAFLQLQGDRLYAADLLLSPGPMPSLAFLNACVTGVTNREARNSDAALSLPHALLAAGTAEVVGTLWEIEDTAALEFAGRFFRRWRGDENTTAGVIVQEVQTKLRQLPRFRDAFLWGAHAVWVNGPAQLTEAKDLPRSRDLALRPDTLRADEIPPRSERL